MFRCALILTLFFSSFCFADENRPKVAVTDLTYEVKLSQFFNYTEYNEKSAVKSSSRERDRDGMESESHSSKEKYEAKSEKNYVNSTGYINYIDRGELRKFTGDIKGEMLKSQMFRLVQGKPYTVAKKTEEIYDIIARIKGGYYAGADYVLFGILSSIEWRNESNPVQGTDSITTMLGMDMVADFSLINTKTLEIKSAFSAEGEGVDMRLVKPGSNFTPSKTKVISQVSKSLGTDVMRQLAEQFEISPKAAAAE